jgi:O-antigen/teichoic acid export membrane protein
MSEQPSDSLGTAVRQWGARGTLSILDQGLLSGSNFLGFLLLGRWLEPGAYGAFVVATSTFLFLTGFQNALILEPMTVIGPSRFTDRLGPYCWASFRANFQVVVGMLVILLGASVTFGLTSTSLGMAFLGVSIASPFVLMSWVLRRMAYLVGRPGRAAFGSSTYALCLCGALIAAYRLEWLTPFNAFLIMAAGAAAMSLSYAFLYRNLFDAPKSEEPVTVRDIGRAHWDYGRWATGVAIVGCLIYSMYNPFVGAIAGLAIVGGYKACENVFQPFFQSLNALSSLVTPWYARKLVEGDLAAVRKKAVRFTAASTGASILYAAACGFGAVWILSALYPNKPYVNYAPALGLLGVNMVFRTALESYNYLVRAEHRADILFWGALAGTLSLAISGIPLIGIYGVEGAAIAMIFGTLVQGVLTAVLFVRHTRAKP